MNFQQMTTSELAAYWAEIKPSIDESLAKVLKSVTNIASAQGKTPAMLIHGFSALWQQHELDAFEQALWLRNDPESVMLYRAIAEIKATFKYAQGIFLPAVPDLRQKAEAIVEMHSAIRQRLINNIEQRTEHNMPIAFASVDVLPNPFIKDLTAHHATWLKLSNELPLIYHQLKLDQNQHNQISHLLNPSEKDFLNAIETNTLEFKGELGYLALARLTHISVTAGSPVEKIRAIALMKRPESIALFYYDKEALMIEVMKLLQHNHIYPTCNKVWLGTAGAIYNAIQARSSNPNASLEATYLNCDDEKWSWGLNRAYVQIAAYLGFKFKLLEQQYPGMSDAMKSGNTASLLIEIARAIRPEDSVHRSQYDRKHRCSASAEEYLLLANEGFRAIESNGFLVFERNTAVQSPHRANRSEQNTNARQRSHSVEGRINYSQSAVSSVLRFNVFQTPPTSAEIRRLANDQSNDTISQTAINTAAADVRRTSIACGRGLDGDTDSLSEIGENSQGFAVNHALREAMTQVIQSEFDPFARQNVMLQQQLSVPQNENQERKIRSVLNFN